MHVGTDGQVVQEPSTAAHREREAGQRFVREPATNGDLVRRGRDRRPGKELVPGSKPGGWWSHGGVFRVLAGPRVDRLRRLGLYQTALRLRDERALARTPRTHCDPRNACAALDLGAIFGAADPRLWGYVSGRIDAAGLEGNFGGVLPSERRAISALVAYLQPKNVLEIGTHVGSSTIAIAATLAGSDARITTVDVRDVNDPQTRPWAHYGARSAPAEIVRGEAPVAFVTSASIRFLASSEEHYDLILLDGDHSAATVYREVPLALSRLAPGGVLLMHDYFPGGRQLWPDGEMILGPYLAVDRHISEGAQIRDVPFGQLPWPTKLTSHATSLAVILRSPQSAP
jgi:predicted O-methyltransferase YrrM